MMSERRVGLYGHLMSLNVTLTSSNDFGMYNCISENSQGQAEGGVHIYGRPSELKQYLHFLLFRDLESKPGSAIPPPLLEGGSTPLVFGSRYEYSTNIGISRTDHACLHNVSPLYMHAAG